jgi:hypothetical protein
MAIASLAAIGTGCGSPSIVKAPPDYSANVTSIPTKSSQDTVKPVPGTGVDPGLPSKPAPIKFYQPAELDRVVAELASDDPRDPPIRVWTREDRSGEKVVDVVLSNSLVNDEGLAKLAGIARLRHLNLDDCREITSAGLLCLAPLKDLRKLSLNRTAVDDAGLAHLPQLAELAELSLTGTAGITDAGAEHLARCRELQVLRLRDTRLGDASLRLLGKLPKLREIWLEGSRVSAAGMAQLEADRPGILIRHPSHRGAKRP